MRIFLVDGTYELFRAYFGAPSAHASVIGREVGAVRALARSLLALVRDDEATHVAVAFDRVIESFRNDLFPGYKTGEGIDPDLFAQFPWAEEAASALGFAVWPMERFEADDALATGAVRYARRPDVEQVVICSPDKDLAQVVDGSRIVTFDRRRKRMLDAEGVVAKFGVPAPSIPDYLALVGDSADGIPGLPRWGAKGAATVLGAYGHLEAIPDDPARWTVTPRGAAGLAQILSTHRDEALLYRTLATLRTDVPLAEDVEALAWAGPDLPRLKELCKALEDPRLFERAAARSAGSNSGSFRTPHRRP